jgi:signal transduction histidine kinase
MDVLMPEMNGIEACKRLKEDPETQHIPIIVLTAFGDKEMKIEYLKAGANDFLAKPVDHVELMVRINNLLQVKRAEEIKVKSQLLTETINAIVNAKKEWEQTVDCIGDIVMLINAKDNIIRCNKILTTLTGKSYPELLGCKWQDVFKESGFSCKITYSGDVEYFHSSGRYFNYNIYHVKDEKTADVFTPLESHAIYDEGDINNISISYRKGGVKAQSFLTGFTSVITLQDITDSRHLTEVLEEKNKELKKAYNDIKAAQSQIIQQEKLASIGQLAAGVAHEINNPVGFIMSNLTSLLRYSDKLSQFIQIQTEAIEGLDVIARSGDSSPVIARGSERSEETPKQSQDRLGTGSTIPKSQITSPEPALSDKTRFFADAQNDKSEGARNDILNRVDELKKSLKIDYITADINNLIRESLDGAERVKKIVQDLKSFSRVDEAEWKMADINAGIESTINIVWNELKYKATVKKEYGDIPSTKCNPGQINQVFMNILVNAAHAIEKQGEITVKTWHDNGYIYISISDTGTGIPKENISRIFEPFFTTKEVGKGTGLGLSIAYDIVRKHNGDITVDSEVGKGSTFTVKIPVVEM